MSTEFVSTESVGGESVVLLSEEGEPIGVADKFTVHGADTPLHLAFSCYVFNADGELLVTRRAVGKRTWPGVWSNSFCGHPGPGEDIPEAVRRRAEQELGLAIRDLRCVLPEFRYRAQAPDGVVENEICPVFAARADTDPDPNPDEVEEHRWVSWPAFIELAEQHPWLLSPWSTRQARELAATGLLA